VVGRSILSNDCVSGLKEVRFVRSSSYGRGSVRRLRSIVRLEGNHEYKSGTRKKLETLAKVVDWWCNR
jgi:hypothetical protein